MRAFGVAMVVILLAGLPAFAVQGSYGSFPSWVVPPTPQSTPSGHIPHVIVGVPDSGINPYHEMYYRPHLTVHPCTYIQDFPCNIPSLPLSVGRYSDYNQALQADEALWSSLAVGQWYWIPKTVFVAVQCDGTGGGTCILDDTNMHGTGTTSSVLSENPDVLIAFKEGNSDTSVFLDRTLPIDIISFSWGVPVPVPLAFGTDPNLFPFLVASSGNEGAFPVILASDKVARSVITVSAADASSRSEPGYSGFKTADFASQYCRPTAQTRSIHNYRASFCGTSFSAPTVAGALSAVILDVRRNSGHLGSMEGRYVDPIAEVTRNDVREAFNLTASFFPDAKFPRQGGNVPLIPFLEWYQWGWGYVDSTTVPHTLACLYDGDCPVRDPVTTAGMEAFWAARMLQSEPREALGVGAIPIVEAQDDAGSGADAPNNRLAALVVPAGVDLDGTVAVQDTDWYKITTGPGQTITLTSQATAVQQLILVNADDSIIRSAFVNPTTPVVLTAQDAEATTWSISVSGPAATTPDLYGFRVDIA